MITFIQTILHKSLWSNIYNGEGRVLFQGFSVGWWKHYTDSSGRKQVFSKPWDSGEFSIIKDWKPFFINLKRGNPEVIPSKDSRFADPCQSLLIFAMPAWGIFFLQRKRGIFGGPNGNLFGRMLQEANRERSRGFPSWLKWWFQACGATPTAFGNEVMCHSGCERWPLGTRPEGHWWNHASLESRGNEPIPPNGKFFGESSSSKAPKR